jgi:hypothetical protein
MRDSTRPACLQIKHHGLTLTTEAAIFCLRTCEDIMANNRHAANRKNALKSTGPKAPFGKTVASRNAVKHGIFTVVPILSGIESRNDWEKHRYGVVRSIAPVGYLEELLTMRLAILSWRLRRVVRYEAEVSTASLARTEADMEERDEDGSQKSEEPGSAREKVRNASVVMKTLQALSKLPDEKKLDRESAVTTLWASSRELPDDRESLSVPGIPDEDTEFDAFDQWTAGLLRKATEVYPAAAGMAVDSLLYKCISSAYRISVEADEEERDLVEQARRWEVALERENRHRILLEPEVLDKVARYESGLERSFFRTLHEIQRLQGARTGAVVSPPAAVDVDLTVHPKRSS